MTEDSLLQITAALQSLLRDEHYLLVSGQARDCAELSHEKARLMRELETVLGRLQSTQILNVHKKDVQKTLSMARENATHFQAVQNGLRNILARLERPGEATYVGAYDNQGGKVSFQGATGAYKKRV